MATAEVALRLDEPDRLRFAHSPLSGVLFTLISVGFAWLCWTFIRDEPLFRYLVTAFALIFVIGGIFGILWRNEIDIDLARRNVRIRRGFWPRARNYERPLDDLDGVVLTVVYRSSGSKNNRRKVPWWIVSLRFPGDKTGTRIFTSRNEVDAFAKWEHYSERLAVDAIDAASGEDQRKDWRGLDQNLADQVRADASSSVRSPVQPAGSAVRVVPNRGRREYQLPMIGFGRGLVLFVVIGGAFVALGSVPLLVSLGVIDVEVSGSEVALMIIPPLFIVAGLGIAWIGIRGSYTSVVIGAANDALFTEKLAFGKHSGREAIPFAEIESIELGGDVRSRRRKGARVGIGGITLGANRYRDRETEVVVRSDARVLRFGGGLSKEEQNWLSDACRFAVVRGHLP